jgi:hypothetical protein
MAATDICVVYWLYDEKCICPWRHGYIGMSQCLKFRLKTHRLNKTFPKGFLSQILFRGTPHECREIEWKLRPRPSIGWNNCAGGGKSQFGRPHSLKARQNMSEAAKCKPPISEETRELHRQRMLGTSNKGRIGQKKSEEERAKISANSIGKHVSEETRRKLSARRVGKKPHGGHVHTEETKARIRMKKLGVPVHSEEHKRKLAERWQGNALTKGRPWSAARRVAWLETREK